MIERSRSRPLVSTRSSVLVAALLAALVAGACSEPAPSSSASSPSSPVAAAAFQPAAGGDIDAEALQSIATLRAACDALAEAGHNPSGQKPALCGLRKSDCAILEEIDRGHAKGLSQPLDLKPYAAVLGDAVPMGPTVASPVKFDPFCTADICKIPVVITERPGKRCQATLPFFRYCVLEKKDAKERKLEFFLADDKHKPLDGNSKFRFVDTESGSGHYQGWTVRGADLHVDRGPGKREPVKAVHFANAASAALSYTWDVGGTNTIGEPSAPGMADGEFGRVYNGVLSAAFVREIGKPGPSGLCVPRDPIIVNAAN